MAELPHERVWTRLGVSRIHGVGVFALRPIPAGTNLFANDPGAMVWVDDAEIADLPPTSPMKRLYLDFAIRRGTRLGCPVNFNALTVGWYVNEPVADEPANVVMGDDYWIVADRDIAEGEELTIDYGTFSG